jgi:hypothetical protein
MVESVKRPKRSSEAVNRRTDNTMAESVKKSKRSSET